MCKESEEIGLLQKLKEHRELEPYINYIRFPYYKNIEENLQINFDFPLTVLVGQNGANKSSVLRAIYGCPKDYNLGVFWFSTDIDPIVEDGGRSRFIYSYYQVEAKRNVEVIKTRIQRSYSSNKSKLNPDYWEPSRPLMSDGMEKMPDLKLGMQGRMKTRWKLMEKNVVFMDFRSQISAFDKYFYHGDLRQTIKHHSKQDFIRSKSSLLAKAVVNNLQTKKMYRNKKEHILSNVLLPQDQVKFISHILGRTYSEVRILNHRFFKTEGESVILSSMGLKYSEAFAGSGEFSVVMLVNKIVEAPSHSLMILDEPEVSLHPGAQEKLMEFLIDQIKKRKHQIVIGTHSPYILKTLPSSAIKALYLDSGTQKIKVINDTMPEEAFFHLGVKDTNKKTIIVEDRLAAELVKKVLSMLGQPIFESFSVKHLPGGASVILRNFLISYALSGRTDTLFILDGDQSPGDNIHIQDDMERLSNEQLDFNLEKIMSGMPKIPVDGGIDGGNLDQLRTAKICILSYCQKFLTYFPSTSPEQFIWNKMQFDLKKYKDVDFDINSKEKFETLCRSELGRKDFEQVTSDEIFQVQLRCLATVDVELLSEIERYIKSDQLG